MLCGGRWLGVADNASLLLVLRIVHWGLVKSWPSRIDTLAAEQFCLDCKDILGSPTLAKHVPDRGR